MNFPAWNFRFLRYNLPVGSSPTYFNLANKLNSQGWKFTQFKPIAKITSQNFEFDHNAAECLEYKHLLARLISNHCPEVAPATFQINDENWLEVLKKVEAQTNYWILKPALLNNGQHIHILPTLEAVKAHYCKNRRLGGEHVLQEYIQEPHLLKGHKYSIRLFVVLTNYNGNYIYPDGYFNVARKSYCENDFTDLRPHLTNEHLLHEESNVIQIPSQLFDFFPDIFLKCLIITKEVLKALKLNYPQAFASRSIRKLAIFGLDFMVDKNFKVWLIEANHGPCFPVSNDHPLQQYLYNSFWEQFILSFIQPIALKTDCNAISHPHFQLISD